MLANSRTPDERGGDLDAQVGANVLGAARLAALVERGEPVDEVLAYGERRMRAALAAMDDGSWTFEDVIDSTGEAEDQQRAARIVVTVTVRGDHITFDFTGTDPQRAGNVNAVESVTVSSVAFALRVATDPTHPGERGRAASAVGDCAPGNVGGCSSARRGRCGQRGGEPARRGRVPRRARARAPRHCSAARRKGR